MVVFAVKNTNSLNDYNNIVVYISNIELTKYYAEMMSYHMKEITRSKITETRVDACLNLVADQRSLIIDKIAISKAQMLLLNASTRIEFNNPRKEDLRIMPEPILGAG